MEVSVKSRFCFQIHRNSGKVSMHKQFVPGFSVSTHIPEPENETSCCNPNRCLFTHRVLFYIIIIMPIYHVYRIH